METMEQGIDTKQLVSEYAKLKKEYDFLSDHTHKSSTKLEKELSSVRGKLEQALEQLKKQQETVVKPLVDECVKREKENLRIRAALQERQSNLKILYAMIRSPKLCDMMYKAERKRFEKEQLEKINQESIHTLRQYNFDSDNASGFVERIHTTIHKLLEDPYYSEKMNAQLQG